MGPKTASSLSFSIFPRLGFTPSRKTESSSRSPHAEKPEEDWYIPYNGPLEPPKGVSMANYDPFGYPVSQDDVNAFLEDSQILDRYRDMSVNPAGPVGLGPPPAESTGSGFRGTRLRSDFTRRTTSSSSVIDTMRPHPRRRQMSAPRLQVLTHVGTDASADVGESPMPMQRITSNPQKKMSRFFGFGSSKKPRERSTSTSIPPISQTTMPGAWLPSSIQHSTIQDNDNFAKPSTNAGNHFDSHHSTLPPPSHRSHTHHRPPRVDAVNLSPSKGRSVRYVDHHGNPDQDSSPSSPVTNYDSPTNFPSHPYANPSSSDSGIALRPSTSQQSHQEHQKLDSGSYNTHFLQNPTPRSRALTYVIDPRVPRATALATHATPSALPLKPSVSTPNLSAALHREQPSQPCKKPVAGTQRWLSAETWCDALFFPRPRLKVRRAHERLGGSSGQLVSPPVTPVAEGAPRRLSPALLGGRPRLLSATHDAVKEHHVLLKSRSAVDVLSGHSISGRPHTAPTPQRRPDPDPIQDIRPKYAESVPGTSTVPQELCPSTPVPSLTQVLEEGEALEQQRKQWQHQASHSFGNSRTRSLSRARARSLSRSQGRPGHKSEGSTALEFLAARTLLGGQSISPTVNVASTSHSRSYSHSTHSHNRSHSRQRSNSHSFTHSHSHSHSLAHSNSQKSSTDPQSTRHARNESWGRTALLKACAPCGDRSNVHSSPVEGKRLALEPMTKNTKVIHLSDPTADSHNGADDGCVIIIGISPGPSTPSGEGVGIALSSPPPSDDHSRLSCDPELTSMPSHPYATGTVYTRYHNPSEEHDLQHTHKTSDYAGPHPSAYDSQLPPNTTARNVSMRHRLPPRAVQPGAISHPYAAAFTKPVTSHARQPSNSVLPTLPVPPSTVQQDKDFTSTHHISISSPDFGKYGIGEALVFAAPSRDEQETDSEDQPLGTAIPCQQDTLTRISDKGKAKGTTPPGSSQSRIPPLDSVIVPTRPPSLISVTTVEGGDSTHSPNTHPRLGPTADITSAHLVVSASENNELDEFQDLFYRPPVQSRSSSGKSSGRHQEASGTSRGIPSDIHSSSSGSALTNLMRSISSGIGELHMATSEFSHGQRSGGRSDELSQTYVFMDMSRTSSPVQVDPPTVLHSPAQRYSVPFEGGVPEDVESSRASSFLMTSQENDTFGHPIRQDVVDAEGTSTILQGSHRASTHVSIHDAAEEVDLVSPISFIHSPLHSPDGVRSSYMTSASEYSHMSALYEFPDPPVQPNVTPNSSSVLQIDDDAPTPPQQPENPREIIRHPGSGSRVFSLDSHRMTFGGGDDVDIITRVHKSER